jgi:hypothetical protein
VDVAVCERIGVNVGDDVIVGVRLRVALGRGVRVAEAVHVGRGVFVGVRVHTIGVRVKVGVAESAAMKTCIRCVLAAEVARAFTSAVGVEVREGVSETGSAVGEMRVDAVAEAGGWLGSGVSLAVNTGMVGSVARGVWVAAGRFVCVTG